MSFEIVEGVEVVVGVVGETDCGCWWCHVD